MTTLMTHEFFFNVWIKALVQSAKSMLLTNESLNVTIYYPGFVFVCWGNWGCLGISKDSNLLIIFVPAFHRFRFSNNVFVLLYAAFIPFKNLALKWKYHVNLEGFKF